MDIEKVFHMNGGIGNTSYAKNSTLQKKGCDKVKHVIIEAIEEVLVAIKGSPNLKSIGIADLGCSSGPNTLSIIKDILECIIQGMMISMRHEKMILNKPHDDDDHHDQPMMASTCSEFRVYLNDLPANDFNSIFKAWPEFHRLLINNNNNNNKNGFFFPSIFMGAYPGSFYGRLFPNYSLHFVHSSYSLHWLSKVPPSIYDEQGRSLNKGCVYISESSPPLVGEAYLKQFQEDFSLFLESRSQEVVVGGRMVLILLGRKGPQHDDRGFSFLWQLLSRSFNTLVSMGEVDEEKVDSYDVHFYAPSREEIEDEVRREGSFELERIEMCETFERNEENNNNETHGMVVAMTVRAIQESMISNHFGEAILDALFDIFATLVDQEVAKEDIKPITYAVVLKKL